jgi:RND family efflux transporter MFP subunit
VADGDALFRIDPSSYEVAVAEARGQLARARASAERAERDFARARELFEQKVVSDAVLDQRRAERDAGAAEVQAAEAAVQAAELDLSWCTVRAPLAGRIGRALIDVGNLVGESGQDTVLAEIVQVDPIHVYFAPTEAERLEAAHGAAPAERAIPVRLELGDGTPYPHAGAVDYVDPTVDPTRGTVTVRARVPNPEGELRPGAFVRVVAVFPDRTDAVLVPQRAVLDEQGGRYVLVVKDDDTVEHRRVTAGVVHDGLQQITQGLAAGERVIADGVQKARPGAKVTPKPASPAESS